MSILSFTTPTIGQQNATEDVDIRDAFDAIKTWANGNIGSDNIPDAEITLAKLTTAVAEALVPVGAIFDYGGDAAPSGYLLCDGVVTGDRTTHAALFAKLGTKYGAGNGTTTFNLPPPKRVYIGKSDDGSGTWDVALGTTGGAETHTLTALQSGMRQHNHAVTDTGHSHAFRFKLSAGVAGGGDILNLSSGNRTLEAADTTLPAGGTNEPNITGISIQDQAAVAATESHNNIQPYVIVNKIIKF
jgi:microcystin-dependent protein